MTTPIDTPEDNKESIKSDTRLAVHIVSTLILRGVLDFDLDDEDDAQGFINAILDTRHAIREAMPMLDIVELRMLNTSIE